MSIPIHPPTTTYGAPSLLRPSSPTSSIDTSYDSDATPEDELLISDFQFARECEARLRLGEPRPEEEEGEKEVLVVHEARGTGGPEETALFESILASLRAEVARLQDEEVFEHAARRGSTIGLQVQPPTTDIDKIMRSMMGGLSLQNPTPSPLLSSPSTVTSSSSSAHNYPSTSHLRNLPASSAPRGLAPPNGLGLLGLPELSPRRVPLKALSTSDSSRSASPVILGLPCAEPPLAKGPWDNYGQVPEGLVGRMMHTLGRASQ